ncbi:exopolysaccharide transport family protein [Ruegeria sp. 2205SS24-7]|uniref:GumC family protein n=1 Tax=Ruegeria discodermiae TaxID=3064389 RepID=UPI0027419969|nr:exopolysaccharide transport family protein [Ruegeria sp. 2205SS24-7]MDP5220687.1 exopolysaccharide transport family protein [Ruegeria sp. 2205SS24-7]
MRLPKAAESQPKTLEFLDVVQAFRRRMVLITMTGVLCLALAVYYLTTITPTYTSGGQLLLGGQGLSEQNSFDLVEAQVLSNAVIEGEIAIMRSNDILINVVRKLKLDEDPEFNPSLREQSVPNPVITWLKTTAKSILRPERSQSDTVAITGGAGNLEILEAASLNEQLVGDLGAAVGIVRRGLSIRQQGTSFLMSVQATSESSQKAAAISNTVMSEYIRFLADKRFQAASRFTGWLEGRVEELANNVEESERAVLELRSAMEADADNGARLDQQMQEFTTKLVNARAELAQAEAQIRRATLVNDAEGPLATANILTSDALVDFRRTLVELRREETAAASGFSDESAQVASIRRAIARTEADLATEVENLLLQLNNRVETLRLNVRTLEISLRSFEGLNLERSRQLIELNQLQRVADINLRVYEDFLGRYREISEFQKIPISDARVIRYATPPSSPSHPRKKVAAVLALIGGLTLGAALALALEWRPKRLSAPRQIFSATGLAVFGSTPRLRKTGSVQDLLRRLSQDEDLARAALNLADNINLHNEQSLRSIFFTSYNANDSKTLSAVLLAWASAQRGKKCVLVDGDFRTAQLTASLGVSDRASFLSAIHSQKPLNECVVATNSEGGFDCIGTQTSAADPSIIYSAERVQDLISLLRKAYDVVIIDAPGLDDVSNRFATLNSQDLGIFTIEANKVTLGRITDNLNIFRDMKLGGAGIILNGPA